MPETQPFVLTIAGFDPSGGAGLTADIKVMQAHRVRDLCVCTAITIQNEDQFIDCRWLSDDEIKEQLHILLYRYEIRYVKIGILPSLPLLNELLDILHAHRSDMRIIWDPVLKASAGFDFYVPSTLSGLSQIMEKIYLATPNAKEWEILQKHLPPAYLPCHIFIKSVSAADGFVEDLLLTKEGAIHGYTSSLLHGNSKHGSGCVLSSAIASALATGDDLNYAIHRARCYTRSYLLSAPGRSGTHFFAL